MHIRFVPSVIIALAVIVIQAQSLYGRQGDVQSKGLSVRQQYDNVLFNMKKNVNKAQSVSDKFNFLSKASRDLNQIRKSNPIQFPKDEIYFDMVEGSMELLPKPDHFKKEDCQTYRDKIKSQFNPKSMKSDSGIESTLETLESICK